MALRSAIDPVPGVSRVVGTLGLREAVEEVVGSRDKTGKQCISACYGRRAIYMWL